MHIDWNEAPHEALWWAMDESGKAHWFLMPDVAPHTDFWFSDQLAAPSFGFAGDWRISLCVRPLNDGRNGRN